ncbi:DUF3305 domain-containing protein [Halomonas urumqiensis]|uniref:DUF3305 domain-containing protein n=1 Tax=Halomonas urumqiensis TaxID=1684789 RepID=A0A2N7UEM1_9GAMM|nr:DUF3305 domain-containing protein [Halomonas urumqiensis]PMR78896.1 DUF3305 domain-containing protein [Halomonas urumqiensis]PTB04370.1 DUF3305 domain-containing protein [Halomonas urumqiensis]GHE19529.1 hypothetical protein GCM10017767_00500 [Halomonas urumqiensis]
MSHTNSLHTLSFDVESETRHAKGFTSTQWRIIHLMPGDAGPITLDLQLYLTERAAYRFNLSAGMPQLFVRCGESGQPPMPSAISASQDVAASWLDGEQQVLEVEMPLAIQVWLEAYLARHGEAPDEGRKKKRKGAGRAREISS